jgi:hypothetical protein
MKDRQGRQRGWTGHCTVLVQAYSILNNVVIENLAPFPYIFQDAVSLRVRFGIRVRCGQSCE